MATAQVALSGVLDTVQQTAKAVGNVINVFGTGAAMLNDSVADLRSKQVINHKLGMVGFTEAAIVSRMLEIDQISERTELYYNEVEGREDRCKLIRAQLEQALA
jgi:hypothetical protein